MRSDVKAFQVGTFAPNTAHRSREANLNRDPHRSTYGRERTKVIWCIPQAMAQGQTDREFYFATGVKYFFRRRHVSIGAGVYFRPLRNQLGEFNEKIPAVPHDLSLGAY
jgi:hypothetical protein